MTETKTVQGLPEFIVQVWRGSYGWQSLGPSNFTEFEALKQYVETQEQFPNKRVRLIKQTTTTKVEELEQTHGG